MTHDPREVGSYDELGPPCTKCRKVRVEVRRSYSESEAEGKTKVVRYDCPNCGHSFELSGSA